MASRRSSIDVLSPLGEGRMSVFVLAGFALTPTLSQRARETFRNSF
jgi:hypothetical protein